MIVYINTDGTGAGLLEQVDRTHWKNLLMKLRRCPDPVHDVSLDTRLRSRMRVREYNSETMLELKSLNAQI